MSYNPSWSNGNAVGRLEAGMHYVQLADARDMAQAIDRRRLLTYQLPQDYSSEIYAGAYARAATLQSTMTLFHHFRHSVSHDLLEPPTGAMGGSPASPGPMQWLWPLNDSDENKTIVRGVVGDGDVNLFQKLNGGDGWTDALSSDVAIRAVHWNELRQSLEWLRRGRWQLPLYFATGLLSLLEDTPWIGDTLANNGVDELRSLSMAILSDTAGSPPHTRGLDNVAVRNSSRLVLTADTDCTVEVYRL